MARKPASIRRLESAKGRSAKDDDNERGDASKAVFPYTTKPGSLRRVLQEVPKKPRPPKINTSFLKGWGLKDSNDTTILRVLKTLELLDAAGVPTPKYAEFMKLGSGPSALGVEIRRVYSQLFSQSHAPQNESDAQLRSYFNIYSGGGERTIQYQIQTFKALCDHASFDGVAGTQVEAGTGTPATPPGKPAATNTGGAGPTTIHIDLHIHLPANKTVRDYEYIFEDIAKHIYGRGNGATSDKPKPR